MKAEIEVECEKPEIVIKLLRPDQEELKRFDIKLEAEKNKLKLKIEAKELSSLLAGINSYLRLIKVAMDAMEA